MTAYSPSQIYTALIGQGIPSSDARTLTAISGAESGYGANQIGSVNRNGTIDYGVFQVNSGAWPQLNPSGLPYADLNTQAAAAATVYRQQGLGAWSTFNNGSYQKYLTDANNATVTTGGQPISTGPAGADPTGGGGTATGQPAYWVSPSQGIATSDPGSEDPTITDWQPVYQGNTNAPGGGAAGGGTGGGGSGTGGAGGTGSEATQAAIPGMILEEPATIGLSTGLAGATDSWIKGAENAVGTAFKNAWSATLGTVTNLALRFFLILAGIVVIGIALWKLLNPGLDVKDIAALMTKVPA